MGLDVRLKMARLYLCTDIREDTNDFGNFVDAAFAGGVDVLQVRQKGLEPQKELEALELARTIAYQYQGIVCVNDNPKLAKEFGADMLHVGQDDTAPAEARKFLHPWGLIGRSTHSEEQAKAALADADVNYFCVGPVYATPTKPDYKATGLELVRQAAEFAPPQDPQGKPWFAIGGVDEHTIDDVIAAGARRVVVVRAITKASDAEAAAKTLSSKLREAWNNDEGMQDYLFKALRSGHENNATFVTEQAAAVSAPATLPDAEPEQGFGFWDSVLQQPATGLRAWIDSRRKK